MVRTLGISAIRYTYDEEDRQKQFRITTRLDPDPRPNTTYTGDIKRWIGNAMAVTQLDIPSESISDCSGTRLGIQTIIRDSGEVNYYNFSGIRAYDYSLLIPENQLVSRYIIHRGMTSNCWEPPIQKNKLFSSIKNHVITALSLREIKTEKPDTIVFDYEYSMFTCDSRGATHMYVFPQKVLDNNFPIDLAPYEIPTGDILYKYPFLNLTSDIVTGYAICDDAESQLNEILIVDRSDGTQCLYYIGCPEMQANPSHIRLNSRTEYPGIGHPNCSGDIQEFGANVNPRTGVYQTEDWSLANLPTDDQVPNLEFNPVVSVINEPNKWEATYYEQAPHPEDRTLDYTHPQGIDISTTLKNVYKIGNPDPDILQLPPCNAMFNIDDPTTSNGLFLTSASPTRNFKAEHPYVCGDIIDGASIQIHWNALTEIENTSILEMAFYRFDYIPQLYPPQTPPTPTPTPLYSCSSTVSPGSDNIAWTFTGSDFRSHFPGPERYYMIASLSHASGQRPYLWSNGSQQNPMDWFYVDPKMTGHVFETYYNKGPGNPGPWSTGHHHMWAEIASQKMIRDSQGKNYIIYHDLARVTGTGNPNEDFWNGEMKTEGLVEFNPAGEPIAFHQLNKVDFAPPSEPENWTITNLRISDLIHATWQELGLTFEYIFVVVITDERWTDSGVLKFKTCARLVTFDLSCNDWKQTGTPAKIENQLIDAGDLFDEEFLQNDPQGPCLPAINGVIQSPVAAISQHQGGFPKAFYVAMEYGYAGPNGFLTLINFGTWNQSEHHFDFPERDVDDACWAYFGAGVGAQICVSRLENAPNPDLDTFIHIFNHNNHLMICEGRDDFQGTLFYYACNTCSGNVWFRTETPFPGFEETLWNKYESELGSGFLLAHFNVVHPESTLPGERMTAGGYPLVERINGDMGQTMHLISNVSFGPARYSPVLIYTKLTDYGFDLLTRTYWANWPVCRDYNEFVIQDNLLQSVYGISYKNETITGFPPDCNNEGKLLPDIVVRPYLSIDENSGDLLAVWQNIHLHYNVCEFDTVFNRSHKILYKIKRSLISNNWHADQPAQVLDQNTSMGAFFPVTIRHQQLNPANPRFSLIYCAGENYSYSSSFNHDYIHPERFNYNIYPTYHSLIMDQIP